MSLLTQQDVLDWTGQQAAQLPSNWQAMLDLAETDVADYLGSEPFTLAEIVVTDREVEGYTISLLLEQGLLTNLKAFTIDGTDRLADVVSEWWTITLEDGFRRGDMVSATYDVGWTTSDEMPRPLYTSILQAYERNTAYRGAGIASERIGDYAVSFTHAATRELPVVSRNSIIQYRKPRLS